MRIITWNCNGALRRKFAKLDALEADVLVIQECEDPARSDRTYRDWAGNHVWAGDNKNKGIGIFARRDQTVQQMDWSANGLKEFLPVTIDHEIQLVGVWTKQNWDHDYPYIGQLWKYLELHSPKIEETTIICGDFNSNQIWDRPGRMWNHSECVRALETRGLRSLYHLAKNEVQGGESAPTFFLHRKITKPYHIDYVFAHEARLRDSQLKVEVGTPTDWLSASDHMPIIIDL